MPCDELEKHFSSAKRRRRSRSRSMVQWREVTEYSDLETNSSRKHGRQEQEPQTESPSKRVKMHGTSEPPSRKDTSTTPRINQKKSRKRVNHRKASRTRNYHELKEKNETLERDLADAKKTLKDMKQDLDSKLERGQKLCNKSGEVQKEHPVFQEACKKKDQELRIKDEAIATKQRELDDKTTQAEIYKRERDQLTLLLETANNKLAATEEKLACKVREGDEVKEKLDKTEQEVEAVRTTNDTNSFWNEKLKQRERRAKDTLKKERDEHKDKVRDLKEEKLGLQQRYNELKTTLKTQENQYSEMITNLQQELQASRPQSQRFNFRVPDEKVKQDFTGLESKIGQFVDKYARPVLKATDQELQFFFSSWSPGIRKFLTCPLLCHLVFEGYIWERLLARIFTQWSEVWTGELGRSLEKALSIAGEETEHAGFESELFVDYQFWRSSSSSFISRLNGEDFRPKYFDSDVDAMVSTMASLCGLPEVTDTMRLDAMGIFKEARGFEIQLRMLKAAYTLRMWKHVPSRENLTHGALFDEEKMIDRSPSPSDKSQGKVPVVDFIMSPGLHKRGSNDGDEYEVDTWLVKMGVVCNAATCLQKSGSSLDAESISAQTSKELYSGELEQEDEDQVIELQRNTDTTASEIKLGMAILDSTSIKVEDTDSTYIQVEDTDSQQTPDPSSTPDLTSGSPAAESHHAAQMHSGTTTNVTTRSRASSKTDSDVHDGKSSVKSANNHPYPMRAGRGRGGGPSAQRTRHSKGPDPDPDYLPGSDV